MRWTILTSVVLGVIATGAPTHAVPAATLKENYQSIIERNPFGLKPPAPPVTNVTDVAKEKAKTEIFLTGITSIGFPSRPKQAYFYTREQGKKDPVYYTMTEGSSKDGIEVLDIDSAQRKVRVKMNNSETLLSFETHGVPVQASKGAIPGVPGVPVPGQMQPGQPGQQPAPLPMPGQPNPTYGNQPAYQNVQPINQSGGVINQNTGTGLRQIPNRRIRGNSGGSGAIPQPGMGMGGEVQQPVQQMDPAEEYLRSHLNRAAQARETTVPMPPLPTME